MFAPPPALWNCVYGSPILSIRGRWFKSHSVDNVFCSTSNSNYFVYFFQGNICAIKAVNKHSIDLTRTVRQELKAVSMAPAFNRGKCVKLCLISQFVQMIFPSTRGFPEVPQGEYKRQAGNSHSNVFHTYISGTSIVMNCTYLRNCDSVT